MLGRPGRHFCSVRDWTSYKNAEDERNEESRDEVGKVLWLKDTSFKAMRCDVRHFSLCLGTLT